MSVSAVVKTGGPVICDAPCWDEETKSLVYVDRYKNAVHRWNLNSKEEESLALKGIVSFVIPSSSGGYIVGLDGTICYLEWETGATVALFDATDNGSSVYFNDGKCDASGRLWAATRNSKGVDETSRGSLYCMRRSGRTDKKIENLESSAGITWSNDNTIMYRSDPFRRKIYAFDFDFVYGEIALDNKRTVIDFTKNKTLEDGHPRGLCCDADGKLWVTFDEAGKIVRYDPITGERLREIKLPVKNVVSCCFGGENLDEMYVTTASNDVANGDQTSASIYRITNLGISGEPVSCCLMDGTKSP